MSAHEVAEHIEHVAHEGGHGGHGGADPRLSMYVGITMALLGVMLAVSAARVGAERTELIEAMVDQQNAHAKYQAQDIKHRMAFLTLQGVHANVPPKGVPGGPNKPDALALTETVDRYLKEADAAKEWVESFDPAIKAHVEGQEKFENAQLLAEIGIVVASIALLLHRRIAWYVALALGVGAVAVLGMTYVNTGSAVHAAEAKIEETGKVYRNLRTADKKTKEEDDMVAEMRTWANSPSAPAVAAPPSAP